jgi:hypothetical protein
MRRMSADASPGGRTALYRFYDAQESLLYVGISRDHWRRRKQHALTQPWYPQVRHQAITWYDTEPAARKAELRAIRQESPQFNVAGAIRPSVARIRMYPMRWGFAGVVLWLLYQALLFVIFIIHVPQTTGAALAWVDAGAFVLGGGGMAVAFTLVHVPDIKRFFAWIERNTLYPEVTR